MLQILRIMKKINTNIGKSFIQRLRGEILKELPYITENIHCENKNKDFNNIKIKDSKTKQNLMS